MLVYQLRVEYYHLGGRSIRDGYRIAPVPRTLRINPGITSRYPREGNP